MLFRYKLKFGVNRGIIEQDKLKNLEEIYGLLDVYIFFTKF